MSSRDSVAAPPVERVPFAPGFLTDDLSDLEQVRLIGSRCGDCGIALLGRRRRCENCTSPNLHDEVFAAEGTVYTFTVQRHRPPGLATAADPWEARPVAWIDLADGPRIIGIVEAAPEQMEIGMRVRLAAAPAWQDADGREAVGYAFSPVAGRQS